ncbi:microprocessor complex subunit partner of drosha [Lycorma delicatula]|uniref:microprocessor complex subunit partner of drosha n=1 Tax=Lycorma delicatula TaxID=130591 RepID=UPI003F51687C
MEEKVNSSLQKCPSTIDKQEEMSDTKMDHEEPPSKKVRPDFDSMQNVDIEVKREVDTETHPTEITHKDFSCSETYYDDSSENVYERMERLDQYEASSPYFSDKEDIVDNLCRRYEEEQKYAMLEPSLREFDVLDEARDSEDFSSSDFLSDSESDVPDDEVEMMLEEGLPEELRGQRKIKTKEAAKEFVRKLKEGTSTEISSYEYDNEKTKGNRKVHTSKQENIADTTGDHNDPDSAKISGQKSLDDEHSKDDKENDGVQCRTKVVLEEIELNHFDLLPEGWIKLTHKSGMPVYLHRKSRVCTMARPYYLGPGSARNHSIPLSAIPCFQYKRALENEKKNAEIAKNNPTALNSELCLHNARIETAAENQAAQSLDAQQIREYCQSLFIFKTINSMKYKSWVARRKQVKQKKQEEQRQRLTLPDGTKLLKFPIIDPDNDTNCRPHKEWIMNPTGKSYVCILHEYLQHALKKQPSYEFKELENPSTPYSATVSINGTHYGTATGASKKQAKLEAAKVALEILIPEMKNKIEVEDNNKVDTTNSGLSIFDEIKIEDPRVAEFCAKTTEPSPYAILLTCLQRNYALTDVKVQYSVNKLEHKKNVFTMKLGSHTATVTCKNKRDGKQRASQAILQALHPHITNWGSLLRLYGNRSVKNVKEKKQEEQEITLLQSKASLNQPNTAILEKLRIEMKKLREKKMAVKPIGKFVPPDDIVLPTLSSTDLNKISL